MSRPATPLSRSIGINAGFSRSINLVRDQDSIELLRAYVPTSRAVAALEVLVGALVPGTTGRALAVVGPYGTGKSAFGLFAGALLSDPAGPPHQSALATLRRCHGTLARRAQEALGRGAGLLRVQINGTPDSLVRQFLLALAEAAERALLAPTLVARVRAAARPGQRMDQVLEFVGLVQRAWGAAGGTGVLIEIDELGKFLEYEALHPQHRELHLLQLLAEQAGAADAVPLVLLVMLHQGFEHYGSRLGRSLRDEWSKVQGRFASIAFLEPAEQTLRVVAASFEHAEELPEPVAAGLFETAAALAEVSALPTGIDLARATDIAQACYPLHPLTLLILPTLCQRIAQNERTLFSYLGSAEPCGLRRRLGELTMGETVGPWEVYDYFVLSQAGGFADPLTYRRWVEVVTALERYDGGGALDTGSGDTGSGDTAPNDIGVRLLKTIGLLNLIGAQRGLKASLPVLRLLFGDATEPTLAALEAASIIHFRRYAQEYRVWAGSDFDLQGALAVAAAEHAGRPLADTLNALGPLPPLVARRATIETGTLRRFEPIFVSRSGWPPKAPAVELPLWIYLAEPDEYPEFNQTSAQTPHQTPPQAVIAVCRFSERLLELVSEWLALEDLPRRHAALQQDPVAQREHQVWLANAQLEAIGAIRSLLQAPETLTWYLGGKRHAIQGRRDLQQTLSEWIQGHCFPQAPLIRNELINRDKPSAAASTGRNKLVAAMLKAPGQEGLGIDKAPAEKSLYLSLLHASGLHRQGRPGRPEHWDFLPPPPADPCRLRPLWHAITDTLGSGGERQVALPVLYQRLQAPPYGVRLGVLPILVITYLLANRREVALYQEGAFCEALTIEQAELLCRRPALFALERFALTGLRADLFQRYLGSIVGNLRDDATLLDIVRPLVRFAGALPEYSHHCAGLSPEAEQVRAAFRQAKRPALLLFEALPQACGLAPAAFSGEDPATVERFIARLIAVLRELNGAYPRLLAQWQADLAAQVLEAPAPDLDGLRVALARRYRGLDRYATRQGTVGAFIRRLSDTHFETAEAWLESVMTLLGNAPPAKWRESHRMTAELRLRELAGQLRELERLSQVLPEARTAGLNGDAAVLVKLVESARGEVSRVIRLTPDQRQAAESTAERLAAQFDDLDAATQVAVVAALMRRLAPTDETHGDQDHE